MSGTSSRGVCPSSRTFDQPTHEVCAARLETAGLVLCLLGAAALVWLRVDVSQGVLPSFWSWLGHRGFVCPLCGGMRAFVRVVALNWGQALHDSLLGTFVAVWLLLTLPFRLAFVCCPGQPRCARLGQRLRRLERPPRLLLLMALSLWLQLYLHCVHGFAWTPLQQLMAQP